MKVFSKS